MVAHETAREFQVQALYLPALINPLRKVSVLAVLSSAERRSDFAAVAPLPVRPAGSQSLSGWPRRAHWTPGFVWKGLRISLDNGRDRGLLCRRRADRRWVMARKMCEWDKDRIEAKWDKFAAMVSKPKYACARCGRVADRKDRLCKPKALDAKS